VAPDPYLYQDLTKYMDPDPDSVKRENCNTALYNCKQRCVVC
jgi:hypothetical protein